MLIGPKKALEYLSELSTAPQNNGNLHSVESFIRHSADTLKVANFTLEKVFTNNPWIKNFLNADELLAASVLHDIGRPLCSRQLYHEIRGSNYLQENGVREGVSDDVDQVYRIAQMIRSHANVGNDWFAGLSEKDGNGSTYRKEFMPIDERLLIPRTWQELLIYWIDSCNLNGVPVDIEKKRKIVEEKYCDPSYRGTNGEVFWKGERFAKVQKRSSKVIISTCRLVEKLIDGHLPKEQAIAYGFL